MIYTLTISPSLDFINEVDKFKLNEINRSKASRFIAGGKGINVSIVLKELGINSKVLGFKSGFTGLYLQQLLDDLQIENKLIDANGFTRINVKINSEGETALNTNTLIINEKHIHLLYREVELLNEEDILVISGNIPSNLDYTLYEEIIKRIDKNVKVVVDAEGDLLLNTIKYKPFLVKPNRTELENIFGIKIFSVNQAILYATKLQELGAKNVIVSLDKDGAIMVDDNKNIYKIENLEGNIINTVGAGDSLVAGFVGGIFKGYTVYDAFILGGACANATVFSDSLATKSNIEKMNSLLKNQY